MKIKRSNETKQERQDDNKKAKERMKRIRAKRSLDDIEKTKEKDRLRKEEQKANQDQAETDYVAISQKNKKRQQRKQRSEKEHLLQNLKAKKGMRLLKEEGNLQDFKRRSKKNVDDFLV